MKNAQGIKMRQRTQDRSITDARITCRPFTSDSIQASDGIMRNFSSTGCYIETSYRFKPGTILIVRLNGHPSISSSLAAEEGLRSISLAEVVWMQAVVEENTTRYGMGVQYLK